MLKFSHKINNIPKYFGIINTTRNFRYKNTHPELGRWHCVFLEDKYCGEVCPHTSLISW